MLHKRWKRKAAMQRHTQQSFGYVRLPKPNEIGDGQLVMWRKELLQKQINWTKIGKRLFAFQQNLFVTNNIHLWQSRSWSCQFISRNVHTNAVCLSSDKLMERVLFMGSSRYLRLISTSHDEPRHATDSLFDNFDNGKQCHNAEEYKTMSQCQNVTMSKCHNVTQCHVVKRLHQLPISKWAKVSKKFSFWHFFTVPSYNCTQ